MDTRAGFLNILKEDYPYARSKKEKSSILDTYCLNSGQSRKYVIRTIRRGVGPAAQERRPQKPIYDEEVTDALVKIWESLGYPCGQRLKPILTRELERQIQSGQVIITEEAVRKLKQISSATIDRKLASAKKRLASSGSLITRGDQRPGN